MSIKRRRDAVLKSNISINSIRDSATNFTKGLMRSRQTASEIVNRTNENIKLSFNYFFIFTHFFPFIYQILLYFYT